MKPRIELGIYTNHTTLGSVISAEDIYKFARKNKMPAVAVTDLGSVRAFSELAERAYRHPETKPIFGAKIILADYRTDFMNTTTVLVKNKTGLKNLYHIISELKPSNTAAYSTIPIMKKYHEGLLYGCSDIYGPFFRSYTCKDSENFGFYNDFFDYFQIKNFYNMDFEKDANKQIVAAGKRLNIPVVAVSDARYIKRRDKICLDIMNADTPDEMRFLDNAYLHTTKKLMKEFSYLRGDAYDVVVENTYKIAEQIETVEALMCLHYNLFDNAFKAVNKKCYGFVFEKYGDNPPREIADRLKDELKSFATKKFADVFLLWADIAKAVQEQDEPAVTRGCSAASFISYCLGITKTNPLPPHYYCPKCKKVEWASDVYSGYDLPEKPCSCGGIMHGDGQNIPCNSFFGYNGDTFPEFDLNLTGSGKEIATSKIASLFGKDRLLMGKAGRIEGDFDLKENIRKYEREHGKKLSRKAMKILLAKTPCVTVFDRIYKDVVMILPKDRDVYDFTPIVKTSCSGLSVSQFSFSALRDVLFSCTFHSFPFMERLKLLEQKTNVKISDVLLNGGALSTLIKNNDLNGITCFKDFDIPEPFKKNGVHTFGDAMKLLGLYFCTDNTNFNFRNAISKENIKLCQIPTYREDIYLDLKKHGIDDKKAFRYMECVRKGLFARGEMSRKETKRFEADLKSAGVPQWYIDYCKNILRLFPKAHGAEYTKVAMIEAWYKVHFRKIFEEITCS